MLVGGYRSLEGPLAPPMGSSISWCFMEFGLEGGGSNSICNKVTWRSKHCGSMLPCSPLGLVCSWYLPGEPVKGIFYAKKKKKVTWLEIKLLQL